MGIPEMDGTTAPVKKRQRLSLKAGRQRAGLTSQSPADDSSNNARKQESECSESSTTVASSLSSSTVDSSTSSSTETSMSTSTTADTDVSSSISKVDVRVPAVASLENLGNTCFMNSIMQVLRYTPGFLHNLALLYQDIQSSEKIKRKNKTSDDDLSSFAEDMNKRCCKVVKNVYKVYRDLSTLEDKYDEVASDDVMSMAVKPNKILSAIRELNPMYEGHMQHDAQEFLRCFLCYFQDAEKEVQKFYSQLPHSFSPKINPIMQRFLASSNASQETKDKIVKIVNEISNESDDKLGTENAIETEKVKVNLFPKAEIRTETAKSPQKVQKVPNVGDTAGVVDKINEKVTQIGASTEPSVSKDTASGTVMHVDLKEVNVTKLPSSVEIGLGAESEVTDTIGKQQKPKALARRNRRIKPYDKDEKIQRPKKDNKDKIIKQRRGKRSKEKDTSELGGPDCDIRNEQKCSTIIPLQLRNENVCKEKSVPVISKSDNAIDVKKKKALETRSYQDVFSQFLSALPEDDTDSVEMQSDSDNEDIVLKKIKEKQLRNSPRRSPRKTSSEMLRPNERKIEISKLALSAKSESSLLTAKQHLDFSENKGGLERKNETECKTDASDEAPSNVPTAVSQFVVKSEIADDGDDIRNTEVPDIDAGVRTEQKNESKSVPIALVPVVKLENCDYILNENGTSVSAAYATKCLTPMKNDRRSSSGSNNYLKQRNQPFSMDISDDQQLKRALAEMLNSPVKSRSKYDLIERTFQGSMMLRTRCLQCESSTERQEDFHDVSVPVRIEKSDSDDEDEVTENKCDLLDLIEASTEIEKLLEENKYYCDECKAYVEAERSMHYDVMPDILTLHLKRFSSETRNPSNIMKINDHVDIPLTLPCLRYKCSQSCLRPDHRYRLYGVVTHSGVTLTSGHYLAYVRALPNHPTDNSHRKQQNCHIDTNYNNQLGEISQKENSVNKSDNSMPATRRKMGVATKLPSRFDDNVIANTKVKAFQSVAVKKIKPDLVASLLPSKQYDEEWFECDDETVRVFDEPDFVELLSEKSGSLLGTPYLLFYHKATMC
ncbi:ubiquitin carboxyl-terminal hydrolase 1-like isoform X2 [Ruditapes philippinarum]|uniref:ubiquitin carboxyl-terminal hydrolase 1-like isoform X2 n=1 Tax=Ruditapes philippinarum TaxID=129788 RepID=UPI00295ABE50|nr:ubiquitin carboxyl-terminal hydrolase 1-like isoform X2 [Ruditapes philippinarum]